MSEQVQTSTFNWMALAALVVSLFSLFVSWYGTARPAKVQFGFNKVAVSASGGIHFVIPTMIANVGARPFTVKDILLIEDSNSKKATYTCWFTVKTDRYEHFLMMGATPGGASEDIEGQFAPFTVFGDSQTSKILAFNLYSGTPVVAPNAKVTYTVVMHTSVGDVRSVATVTWPQDVNTTLQQGGAKISVVEDAIEWRNGVR